MQEYLCLLEAVPFLGPRLGIAILTQQFKLTYRKIYGLVNFIGLAERDRFELSGQDLEEWLAEPSKGKEILLRNLGGDGVEEGEKCDEGAEVETVQEDGGNSDASQPAQITLFDTEELVPVDEGDEQVSSSHPDECPFVVSKALTLGEERGDTGLDEVVDNIVLGIGI